jgi:isovaleryl-CoA dehydrogenase
LLPVQRGAGLLTPELTELVGRATEIARAELAPRAEAEDAAADWPEPAMRALQQAGLMGLNVPAAQGGRGQGLLGLVAITEALARESASAGICYAMHCVGTAVIAAKATPAQVSDYLEPIAAGDHITTLALSEPGTGAHFYLPESRLRRDGDSFTVDGVKSFVTNGGHADSYVVSTQAADAAGGDGTFSCIVVEADDPGLQWREPWDGFGMRANSSRTLELQQARVPAGRLLGREGDQIWYVFEVVAPWFLMAMAGTYLGVAAEALEMAREHLGARRHTHSGELLGSNDVLAHRLGSLFIAVEQTRHLARSAAARADAGDASALPAVFAAKAAASEAAVHVTNEAMTLCGGRAYMRNGKLARLLRDARAGHVMSPTTDILKTWIGRASLQLPLI